MEAELEILLDKSSVKFLKSKSEVTVTENDPSASLNKLTLRKIPKNSVLLKPESLKRFSNFFKFSKCHNANMRCDFVLLSKKNEKENFALLGELKSLNPNIVRSRNQLVNTKLFVRYIFSILEEADNTIKQPDFEMYVFSLLRKETKAPKVANKSGIIKRVIDKNKKIFHIELNKNNKSISFSNIVNWNSNFGGTVK